MCLDVEWYSAIKIKWSMHAYVCVLSRYSISKFFKIDKFKNLITNYIYYLSNQEYKLQTKKRNAEPERNEFVC